MPVSHLLRRRRHRSHRRSALTGACVVVCVAAVLGGAACGVAASRSATVPLVQPGAPGSAARTVSVAQATDLGAIRYTAADVAFMQGMLMHHAQAVEMTSLLRSRTARQDMRQLAARIDASQDDEMRMMREWLTRRGVSVDGGDHAQHGGGSGADRGNPPMRMPGMLSPEQMQTLAAARGAAFDQLFLTGMTAHHEGALQMVADLFATPGAGQESEIYAFASDVEADQRAEIARMRTLLQEMSR